MANGIVGRLRALLGLDATSFEAGLRRQEQGVRRFATTVQSSLSGAVAQASGFGRTFAAGIAGGLVTAAFAGVTTSIDETIRGIAEIGNQANRAGLGVEQFQEWAFVAKQNRIEVDAMTDSFREMQLRADEFIKTGTGSGAEAFRRLGFDASDLGRRLEDPSELMMEIIRRTSELDRAGQIRVFDEILGGEGGERFVELLGLGEGKIRDTIKEARELGAVLNEGAIQQAKELNEQFGQIQQKISTALRETAVSFSNDALKIGDTMYSIRDLIELAERAKDSIASIGSETAPPNMFGDLKAEMAATAGEMMKLSRAVGDVDKGRAIAGLAEELRVLAVNYNRGDIEQDAFLAGVEDVKARAEDAMTALGDIDTAQFDTVIGRLGTLGEALLKVIGLGQRAKTAMPSDDAPIGEKFGPVQEVWRNPDVDLPERATQPPERPSFDATENWIYGIEDTGSGGGGGATDKQEEYASRIAAIREETAALEAEAVALLAVNSAQQDYGDVVEYARRRAELLYAAQKDGRTITPELKAEVDALARAYTTAGMNAEEAADRLRRIEEAGERGADAITDIFLSLRQGADGLKDALGNLLLQIAQIQIQKALLSGIGGLGGEGGGPVGWLGNLLTLPGNAGGTAHWRGGITRVNELGGEILDLPTGTRIYPNDISKRMADQQAKGSPAGPMSMTIDLRGTTGDRELDAKIERAGEAVLRRVPAYMNDYEARNG